MTEVIKILESSIEFELELIDLIKAENVQIIKKRYIKTLKAILNFKQHLYNLLTIKD